MTPEPHVRSYWLETAGAEPEGMSRLSGSQTAEVVIIGGATPVWLGHIASPPHIAAKPLVLEANRIGWGASGRKGGFASFALGKVTFQERIGPTRRTGAPGTPGGDLRPSFPEAASHQPPALPHSRGLR